MTQVHRIMGVFMVCLMLLASIGGTAYAQSEGDQDDTNTQQGGGQPLPPRDEPAPEPQPEEPDEPESPAPQPNQPPSSGQPNEGGGNSAPTTGQGGQQGPDRPQPTQPPSSNDGGGTGGGSGQVSILIDLSDQMLYAYRGDTQVLASSINSGKWGFETPTGTFAINSKYLYDDMSGCEGGECWDVPAVPYAMYFTGNGHAIHGAYWTSNFGNPASHGCVNLPVSVAGQLYDISPIGTRVVVRW